MVYLALAVQARAADGGAATNYTGTVVDEKGQPVAGASVDCYHDESRFGPFLSWDQEPELTQHTVTDREGSFTFSSSPGAILTVVKKAGFATGCKIWFGTTADSSGPLVLTAPTTLAGTVVDENNQPVAGAEVWVSFALFGDQAARNASENKIIGQPAREAFFARTSADGRFRIGNFPAGGQAGLVVRKAGKAQRPIGNAYAEGYDCQSGDEDIELIVGPAGIVKGKVVVAETSQPLQGVQVQVQGSMGGLYGTESRAPIESGADGTFRIPDVQPGKFNVMASLPGHLASEWVVVPENNLVTVRAGETVSNAVVHVSKGALVQVTVVTTNDLKPLAQVAVSSLGSSAYTDAKGVALVRVPTNDSWLSVSKQDWSPQNRQQAVTAGRTNYVRVELIPPPRISGTVRDQAGAPVSGVLVSFHPGQYPGAPKYVETKTDANGQYELTMKEESEGGGWDGPISDTDFILARSVEWNLAAVREFKEMPTNLDLILKPGITLSGCVQDTAGAPVTNATVALSMMVDNFIPPLDPQPARVDAQGIFTFPAMPQGREYYFIQGITAKGYGTAGNMLKALETRTNHYEFPPFVLKRADRKLAGKVLGPDGKPLAGATVNLSGQGQPGWPAARSNSRGIFVFDEVCEGPVTLSASWFGPPEDNGAPTFMSISGGRNLTAQAGDTNLVIRMQNQNQNNQGWTPQSRTITGTVFDRSGAPAPGLDVMLTLPGSDEQTQTDHDGKYTIDWQDTHRPGNMAATNLLIVRDLDHDLVAAGGIDDTTTSLDLHLQPALTISANVVDPNGQPVTNVIGHLEVLTRTGSLVTSMRRSTFLADRQGRVQFKTLPPGFRYSIILTARGYGIATPLMLLEADTQTNHLDLPVVVLKPAILKTTGYVLDADGWAVPGARVTVTGQGQPSTNTVSDGSGHFALDLCEGPVTITASVQGATGRASAVGGDTNVVLKLSPPRGAVGNPQTSPAHLPYD